MDARAGDAAERRFRFELAAHPSSAAQARRLTRAGLAGWSVGEDTCESALLVVSELVTNAIVHTASAHIVCEVQDGVDTLRIAVCDEGCAPGELRRAPRLPEEEHGRGLLLVEAVSVAWGMQEQGVGLMVWSELARSASGRTDTVRRTSPDGHGQAVEAVAPHGHGNTPGGHGHRVTPDGHERGSGPDHGRPRAARDMWETQQIRGDLGWGARPRPGPQGDTDDDDEATEARQGSGTEWV